MRIAAWPELSVERIALEEGLFFDSAAVLQLHLVLSAAGECALLDRASVSAPVNEAELWLVPPACALQWRVGMGLARVVVSLPPELSERTLAALNPLCAGAAASRLWREAAASDAPEYVETPPQVGDAPTHNAELRIHLSAEYFAEMQPNHCAHTPLRVLDPVLPHFAEIARAQSGTDHETRFHLAFAHTLLAHLLNKASALQPKTGEEESGEEIAQVAQLRAFVDERLGYDLGVEDLARHTKMSKFQLLRLMKKHLAQTPQQFVIQRRIDKAKLLLRGSDASLADIAFQTGFSSQSHLSNTFKQLVGATPKGYRDGV
jgi:AraC-like DNA-binding protein